MKLRGKLSLSSLGRAKSPVQTYHLKMQQESLHHTLFLESRVGQAAAAEGLAHGEAGEHLLVMASAMPYLQQTKGYFLGAGVMLTSLTENS